MAGLFEAMEKLITEHGSAAILREHLALIRAEQAILEKKNADLAAQLEKAAAEKERLQTQAKDLEQQLRQEQSKLADAQSQHSEHMCDHCGSSRLKRTGSRANATFGDLGVKDFLYRCDDCGKETAVMQQPK